MKTASTPLEFQNKNISNTSQMRTTDLNISEMILYEYRVTIFTALRTGHSFVVLNSFRCSRFLPRKFKAD